MQYKILKKNPILKSKFFNIEEVELEMETFTGQSIKIKRYAMIRREVVAVLLERTDSNTIIFVEQFRYSAVKIEQPWITEIIAGVVDPGESPLNCAKRETLEETGYEVDDLQFIQTYMPNVGISNQVIHFYFGQVTEKNKINAGGGLLNESEDIRVHEISVTELRDKLKHGSFKDAKTLLAIQWYFLNQADLPKN